MQLNTLSFLQHPWNSEAYVVHQDGSKVTVPPELIVFPRFHHSGCKLEPGVKGGLLLFPRYGLLCFWMTTIYLNKVKGRGNKTNSFWGSLEVYCEKLPRHKNSILMCGVEKILSDRKILDKGMTGGWETRIFKIPGPHKTMKAGAFKKILGVHCTRSSAM